MERPGDTPAPSGGGAADEDLDRYLRALEQTDAEDAPEPAAALAELVSSRAERGEYGPPEEVRPMYMREPGVTLGSVHRREGGLWA